MLRIEDDTLDIGQQDSGFRLLKVDHVRILSHFNFTYVANMMRRQQEENSLVEHNPTVVLLLEDREIVLELASDGLSDLGFALLHVSLYAIIVGKKQGLSLICSHD